MGTGDTASAVAVHCGGRNGLRPGKGLYGIRQPKLVCGMEMLRSGRSMTLGMTAVDGETQAGRYGAEPRLGGGGKAAGFADRG